MTDHENRFQKSDESLNEEEEQNVIRRAITETPVNGNKKLVVAPHRKRNVIRSRNQIYLEIKTYKQMSLGNVNICHTIIINCDHPRIKAPHKTKKTWLNKDMFHCCSYADVLMTKRLRIKTRLLC